MFEGKARVRWCRRLRVCQNSQRLAEPTNQEILFIKFLGLFIYSQNKINKIIFHQQSGFLLVRFLWPYKENELIIKKEILFIKFLGLFIYSQNKINKIIFHQQSGFLLVRFLWPYKENELIIKKFIHFLRCFHIFINFHCRFY